MGSRDPGSSQGLRLKHRDPAIPDQLDQVYMSLPSPSLCLSLSVCVFLFSPARITREADLVLVEIDSPDFTKRNALHKASAPLLKHKASCSSPW